MIAGNMQSFKVCTKCGKVWQTREQFLELEELVPLGFQAHFLDGEKSILMFHHETAGCNTTLAIPLQEFVDLIPGYHETELAYGTDSCRAICLTDNDLMPCDHPNCKNALVRQFVQELAAKKELVPNHKHS